MTNESACKADLGLNMEHRPQLLLDGCYACSTWNLWSTCFLFLKRGTNNNKLRCGNISRLLLPVQKWMSAKKDKYSGMLNRTYNAFRLYVVQDKKVVTSILYVGRFSFNQNTVTVKWGKLKGHACTTISWKSTSVVRCSTVHCFTLHLHSTWIPANILLLNLGVVGTVQYNRRGNRDRIIWTILWGTKGSSVDIVRFQIPLHMYLTLFDSRCLHISLILYGSGYPFDRSLEESLHEWYYTSGWKVHDFPLIPLPWWACFRIL